MSDGLITSRIGNRSIEVPIELISQLRHERELHDMDIKNRISEAESNGLLADAERIKDAAHIKHADDSSA